MVPGVPRYLFLFLIPIGSSGIGGNASGSIQRSSFNKSVRVSTCHTTQYVITSASMVSIEEAAAWETRKRLVAGELENYLNT